jgi:hypothetical protein
MLFLPILSMCLPRWKETSMAPSGKMLIIRPIEESESCFSRAIEGKKVLGIRYDMKDRRIREKSDQIRELFIM